MKKIFLSPPVLNDSDLEALAKAKNISSPDEQNNMIEKFENELSNFNQVKNVVVVNSGTSALHLGLISLGVKPQDKILLPTLTFAATAFAIKYLNATPIFFDVSEESWTIDLDLVSKYLKKCKVKELPKVIIPVDIFGRTCDYDSLKCIADQYEIPLFIDAAESLGSKYKCKPSTSHGRASILSFNSNKILTTTGGGAFLTNDNELADKVRYFANQARENVPWYEHKQIGYNYRLSPILALIGASQLSRINNLIEKRIHNRLLYTERLKEFKNVNIISDSDWEISNSWLVNLRLFRANQNSKIKKLNDFLNSRNICSRFIWKPLHKQVIFQKDESILTGVADTLYRQSLCLPNGSDLSDLDISRICNLIGEVIKE